MPRRDGTGPAGQGPMTGGQRGWCDGASPRPLRRDGTGRGMGYGRGPAGPGMGRRLGRGMGRRRADY